jgi:hypothetical protein
MEAESDHRYYSVIVSLLREAFWASIKYAGVFGEHMALGKVRVLFVFTRGYTTRGPLTSLLGINRTIHQTSLSSHFSLPYTNEWFVHKNCNVVISIVCSHVFL